MNSHTRDFNKDEFKEQYFKKNANALLAVGEVLLELKIDHDINAIGLAKVTILQDGNSLPSKKMFDMKQFKGRLRRLS